MIPIGIMVAFLATPQAPERVVQPVMGNLLVTTRGCAWRPQEALPEWCGPLLWEQGKGEKRQLREHERREIRQIRRRE